MESWYKKEIYFTVEFILLGNGVVISCNTHSLAKKASILGCHQSGKPYSHLYWKHHQQSICNPWERLQTGVFN